MTFQSSNPLPVTIAPSALSGPALPVYVDTSRPPQAGRARRVVVVTSGPVLGCAAIPVANVGDGATYTDDPPIPVYVVGGGILDPLAYTKKLKAAIGASLIAYWPLAELSGSTALDASGNARNGAYVGVDLGQTGIGDGRTSPLFDGANDCVNVYSASLAGAFNGTEGTLMAWGRVNAASVWTDGTARRIIRLGSATAGNRVEFYRTATNNQFEVDYVAGGTAKGAVITMSPTAWFHVAVTWSKSGDAVKVYLNGTQQGATGTGLGVWAGALSTTQTVIGANTTTPTSVWNGTIAHVAVCNVALSAPTIAQVAVL